MPHVIVRRTTLSGRSLLGPAVAGLALGAAVGFVLGEVLGPRAERGIGSGRSGSRSVPEASRSMVELVHDALSALAQDADLSILTLEVIPVSRQVVELHGWVGSRTLRTRAARVVAERVGADSVVNRILVHGEDDALAPALDILSA